MGPIIGNARDFYRLRVMHVDESDVPDFEWHDDILYRRPEATPAAEYDVWRVEAVSVDDETVTPLATFPTAEEARAWHQGVEEDIADMTKSQFEAAYFPGERDVEGGTEADLT